MRALHKKLLRTLRRSWGQSMAVCAVVACGIACYICMYAAYLNLEFTRDQYYSDYRLSDFEIMVERAPQVSVFKIEEIPGVRQARGRMMQDVPVDIDGIDEPRVGRIISMPNPRRPVLNDVALLAGRYFSPGAQDEVIVNDRFAETNGLAIGDSLQISVENRKYRLRIVGLGLSPEYVYIIRNLQEMLPSPERFGLLWCPKDFAETALNMQAACNNIVGSVDDPEALEVILDQADALLEPYGVFAKVKQSQRVSTAFLADELKGLRVSAQVMPTLFLGIAALILLVLLNRMVRNERTQIGLMKAFGYSNLSVALHYLQYALLLAFIGTVVGLVAGHWLGAQLLKLYGTFYQFPKLLFRVYPEILLRSIGTALFFALLGALYAAYRAANIHPAESMRPEAPRSGHRIWIEAFPMLWRRLSFTWKMIARNMARNAFRSGLNVFGAAISTALLMMGFYSIDAMDFAMDLQFKQVQREDVKVSFQREHGKATYHEVRRFPEVRYAEPVLEYPFELRSAWRKKETVITGLPRDARLQKVMGFAEVEMPLEGPGLVLSGRLAQHLNVGVGDKVLLKPLMGRVKKETWVPVAGVVRQFMGLSAFMELESLSRILDEPYVMNAALIDLQAGQEAAFKKRLKDVGGIAGVAFSKDIFKAINDTIAASMQGTNVTLLLFAGIIAFSIIYNITLVSLAERQRELASLRVMGLHIHEVGRILYHENAVLGVVGVALGIPLGLAVCGLLVAVYDNDLYRLPFYIAPRTYLISTGATLFFVLLANLAARRKVQRLDLIEVLKARE